MVDNTTAPALFNNGTITITSVSNTTNTTRPANSTTGLNNTSPSNSSTSSPVVSPEEAECLGRCTKKMCCLLQYNRLTKQCSLCDMECDQKGNAFGQGYRITYKRDGPWGSPVGKLNAAQQYHRCKLYTDDMLTAYLKLGYNLDSATAKQQVSGQAWVNVKNEQDCRDVCSASLVCWGFIYNTDIQPGGACLYKGGTDDDFAGAGTYATFLY